MDELDQRIRSLEAERAQPDAGEHITVHDRTGELLQELIGVLAAALQEPRPHRGTEAALQRAAEYDRLRNIGLSRAQAAEDIGVYSRTTICRYERQRAQGAV